MLIQPLRHRRMVRWVTPIISAASHHFSLPAAAFNITSYAFIIRSISAAGICCSSASTPFSFSHSILKQTSYLLI
jgi:hypothetical protein